MKKSIIVTFLLMIGFIAFAQEPEVPVDPGLNVWAIVSVVLGVLTSIFGVAAAKFRKKLKQVVTMIKEGVDVIVVLTEALDDNNINPDEIAALKKAVAEFKTAWKLIWLKG